MKASYGKIIGGLLLIILGFVGLFYFTFQYNQLVKNVPTYIVNWAYLGMPIVIIIGGMLIKESSEKK